ncbi:phosphomevalonate kinase [Virgibacillus natechei]|uniref:phosphomevalonate kinase n=1 Tax=Virgibacillus natechei TaxID=1216297 RepID=A0ABS4IGC4_9BACI|nr:phosphomevalonate kinase [Virgibacillus natechei]MBP1969997.1 phosphomevalonate kinase [Virgibacillus natechei]UZD13345.1 phosphomevalonate kinase [Virgibacillus natechei]
MPNTPMTIKVPGKLMIAGEFAVLEPHHHLVVMAVDRFVYASIQKSDTNSLTLQDFQLEDLTWEYKNSEVKISSNDRRTHFVGDAMTTAVTYLKENSITPDPFALSIKSELDDASGVKYGLGSSAAVVTSVIAAILKKYLPDSPDPTLVFKLAAIAHVKTQRNGSGADVAASSYGGFINYSSFQAEWLLKEYENTTNLIELVRKEWSYFSAEKVKLPENIYVCIGWTGKPASTKKLVNEILQLKKDNPAPFRQFLTISEQAVRNVLQGMKEANTSLMMEGMKQNRAALAQIGEAANVAIETPLLTQLCDLAEEYGGAGKPSGAGGGDCGIAFMPSKEKAYELERAWEKVGIKPLILQPNEQGALEEA